MNSTDLTADQAAVMHERIRQALVYVDTMRERQLVPAILMPGNRGNARPGQLLGAASDLASIRTVGPPFPTRKLARKYSCRTSESRMIATYGCFDPESASQVRADGSDQRRVFRCWGERRQCSH
jgi:hypothetical protein